MQAQQNHYQVLGLDLSASKDEIRAALQHMGEQADGLAYSSPERSREMWARIREIRADLLSSGERRYAYDCNIVDGWGADGETTPIPMRASPAAVVPLAVVPASARSRQPLLPWFLASLAGLMVFALFLTWLVNRQTPHHGSVAAVALTTAGKRNGSLFASGSTVTLRWSPVPNAGIYRLQLVKSPGIPTMMNAFTRPWRTVLAYHPWYQIAVLGQQVYSWRVQAFVDGHWTAYSRSKHFGVDVPRIGAPAPVLPANGSVTTSQLVRLCWSPVPGAVGYHLRIRGIGGMNVEGTCRTETLQPNVYRWTVAALVRGAHTYIGSYSERTYFTVAPKSRHELAVRRTHSSRRAAAHTTSGTATQIAAVLRPVSRSSVSGASRGLRSTPAAVHTTTSSFTPASSPRTIAAVTRIGSPHSAKISGHQHSTGPVPRWVPVPRSTVVPAPRPTVVVPPPVVPIVVPQPALPPPPPPVRVERTNRAPGQDQKTVNIYTRTQANVSVGRPHTTSYPTGAAPQRVVPVQHSTAPVPASRPTAQPAGGAGYVARPSPTSYSHSGHGSKR